MTEPLISIIMSTYNEDLEVLHQSICSTLEQSYMNLEIIIVNDNPNNTIINDYLKYIDDERVTVIFNDENMGLVNSLNTALQHVHGDFIARMDADDICYPTRIYDELYYLKKNKLDIVGSFIELIDENGITIKKEMKFPTEHYHIRRFMRWGNCLCHPTWLAKKKVYDELGGYRKAPYCEDYDFLLRALQHGFVLGNIPKEELKYRIRKEGISKKNNEDQFLLRDYLAIKFTHAQIVTENDIFTYLQSKEFFKKKKLLENYYNAKSQIKAGGGLELLKVLVYIPFNQFFWKDLIEKVSLYLRER